MHLYGKLLPGIDELHEQRKLVAEACIVLLAYQPLLKGIDKCVQRPAFVLAVCHDTLVILHAGDFPAFAYLLLV